MLTLKGQPHNIKTRIIGKLVTRPPFLGCKDVIYLTLTQPNKWKGLISCNGLITILDANSKKSIHPTVYLTAFDYNRLHEGDIVAIEPDGNINVIYEIGSMFNALFVTEMCNCRCIMCPQPPFAGRDNMTEEIIKIINLTDRKRTPSLGVTGGEPTLLGDGFSKIIRTCKDHLPNTHLSVLTNAKLLKDIEYVRNIVRIGHPDLFFCIPIYASTDTEHDAIVRSTGSFYDTLSAIHNLALFKQHIEIRFVVMKQNWRRLLQWCDFIYRNMPFVNHIALMGMETTGLAEKNIEAVWVDPIEYANVLRNSVQYLHQRGMNVSLYNMQLCVLPKAIWKYSKQSISNWKNIFLDECLNCSLKKFCSGFFQSAHDFHSVAIKAVLDPT